MPMQMAGMCSGAGMVPMGAQPASCGAGLDMTGNAVSAVSFQAARRTRTGGGDSGRGRTESCLLCFASFCRRRLFAVSLHFRGTLSLSGARFTRIRVPRMRCRQAPSPDAVRTREKCADSSVRPRPFSRSISYIFFLFFCSRRRTKLEFTIDRPSPPLAAPSSPSAPRPSTPALTPRSKR